MELEELKDTVFDLLNDEDSLPIADIEPKEKENILVVKMSGGSAYEIEFRECRG